MFNLQNSDLRLLRIFMTIVESGGMNPALIVLNISPSTLSSQLADLEARLKVRLCERGRGGFSLTEDGKRVYEAGKKLFSAIVEFQSQSRKPTDQPAGRLRIGVVDGALGNIHNKVSKALALCAAPDRWFDISVESVQDLERHVLDGHLDMAIGAFHRNRPGLQYRELYKEENCLYCASGHPLFGIKNKYPSRRDLVAYDSVGRGYNPRSVSKAPYLALNVKATAAQMEAAAMLILSGKFIGYLPTHYGKMFGNQLRELLPPQDRPIVSFDIAMGKSARKNPLTIHFCSILIDLHQEK